MSKFDPLRSEIVESQKSRADLVKWKIILLSTIGFGGLGLKEHNILNEPILVLCILPFVSIYVDMFCRQLALRAEAIGVFIQKAPDIIKPGEDVLVVYENFFEAIRKSKTKVQNSIKVFSTKMFYFEHWVLFGSTVFISASVFLFGVVKIFSSIYLGIPLIISATLAFVLAYLSERKYGNSKERLRKIANEYIQNINRTP